METRLEKRDSPDRQGAGSNLIVRRGSGHDRGRHSGYGCVVRSVSYKKIPDSLLLAGSIFQGQIQLVRLNLCSNKSSVAILRMRTSDYARLSKTLGHNNQTNALSVSAGEGVERILEVTAERDPLLLRLNDCRCPRKTWNENYRNKISF